MMANSLFGLSPDAMRWMSAGAVDLFTLVLLGAVIYWLRH
jgi:hypothetical protein